MILVNMMCKYSFDNLSGHWHQRLETTALDAVQILFDFEKRPLSERQRDRLGMMLSNDKPCSYSL